MHEYDLLQNQLIFDNVLSIIEIHVLLNYLIDY